MQVIEGPGGRLVDFAGTHLLNFNSGRWLFLSLHHTLHYDHTVNQKLLASYRISTSMRSRMNGLCQVATVG